MPNDSSPSVRLGAVLADYYRRVEAGEPIDETKLIADNPDLAAELKDYFRTAQQLNEAATPEKPSVSPETSAQQNHVFGDYELLCELGRGGMGVVYKARQISLNRHVAVKMILAGDFASKADIQRFHTEAEAAANLDHPQIVPIYQIGTHRGHHYFSMKLMEGGSLAQIRAQFRLRPREAAQLVYAISDAVHHAHQHGILHRDLKPANILLDSSGKPHVADFGLARPVGSEIGLTQSGAVVGTPSYMAPEQASGQSKRVSTAVDIYSLGSILYELLTGQRAFQGDSDWATIQQLLESAPVSPRSLNPLIHRDLDTICLKCLSKDPQQRYGTAAELAADLARWLNNEPIKARRAGESDQDNRYSIDQENRWQC
jgi:serine/threonine-protein kinase